MPTDPPDWDAMRRSAQSGVAAPEWPVQVRQISVEGLGLLGIDADRHLYWDGKRIELRQSLLLSRWQKIGAVLVVAASVAGGLGAGTQAVVEVARFGCRLGWWHDVCAPAAVPHAAPTRPAG